MAGLYTEIEIDAPAETVWRILMDFENYPSWNPFIRRVEGETKPGSALKVFIQPSGGTGMTMKPNVVEHSANVKFSWLGSLLVKGLFDGKHEFLLEPLPGSAGNKVKFIQREEFSGILAPVIWALIKKNTRRGFEEMNSALKVLAEKNLRQS
jgi:hypothetical protein